MMLKSEEEYLVTFREARKFERIIRRLSVGTWEDVCRPALVNQRDELLAKLAEYDRVHCFDRKGTWITTWSGRRFWFDDPRPQDVCIEDIAQGLSRIFRYNGATLGQEGYTVAQHSVLASRIVPADFALPVLLHDASEAYAGDVVAPLKERLGRAYLDVEDRIMAAVAGAFGYDRTPQTAEYVRWADRVMLATEVRDLVPLHVLYEEPDEKPMAEVISPWPQHQAKWGFLNRFEEVTRGRPAK